MIYIFNNFSDLLLPKLPSKKELLSKIEKEGAESLTLEQIKLVKRRMTTEKIKENNLLSKKK